MKLITRGNHASGVTPKEVSFMARSKTITKVCTRTGFKVTGNEAQVAEHFYRDKSQRDGFSPWSKDAEREYNKAYRAALTKAKVERKRDADDKGVSAFDNTMKRQGARTQRAKAKVAPKAKARTRKVAAKA
jgi:hypothetical protein